MKNAVKLYERTAKALNVFFDSWTAHYCQGCFKLCQDSYPDDEFANMELNEGVFPGCCQAGVAEDFRIMGCDDPMPAPFVSAIRKERHDFLEKKSIAYSEGQATSKFILRDKLTGQLNRGIGCKWLGEGGCVLEQWKSPICLAFICEPVRQWLTVSCDSDQWALEDDFCDVSKVLAAIGTASLGKQVEYNCAFAKVEELERCLMRHSARLQEVSGVSQ